MKLFTIIMSIGVLAVTACKGDGTSEETSAESANIEGEPSDDVESEETGAPHGPDEELVSAFFQSGEDGYPGVKVLDGEQLSAELNERIFDAYDADAHNHNSISDLRLELYINGLEDMSEDELMSACEAVTAYLLEDPDPLEITGPIAMVGGGTTPVTEDDGTERIIPTDFFYNSGIQLPDNSGTCVVL